MPVDRLTVRRSGKHTINGPLLTMVERLSVTLATIRVKRTGRLIIPDCHG